jgi:hypothetical protein
MKKTLCVICGKPYELDGCDAMPVTEGRCCNRCDDLIVTPARLSKITGKPPSDFYPWAKDMHALTKFYRLLNRPSKNSHKNGD